MARQKHRLYGQRLLVGSGAANHCQPEMRGRKARACRVRQLTERVCVGLSEYLGRGRHSDAYGRARGWFTECDQYALPCVRAHLSRND